MSLHRFSHTLSRALHLKPRTLIVLAYSTTDNSGCCSDSGSSRSEKDSNTISSECKDSKSKSPTFYDCRKLGHNLPTNNVKPEFETLSDIPTGIFRCTADETLGSGVADGVTCYQNPEYFSYHHMSYYDMHWALRRYRKPSPNTGRKK